MNFFLGFITGFMFFVIIDAARESRRMKRLKKHLDGQEETERLLKQTLEN